MRRRAIRIGAAAACFVLAALLVALAADAARWRSAFRSDDVRYQASADAGDLWSPTALVPFEVGRTLLGVKDDLAFREAMRSMRLSKLEDATNSDPTLVIQRADAQSRLEALIAEGGDAARRSRALTLLAVLQLSIPATDPTERAAVLRSSTGMLREAIALDPANDDAKYNLEAALRTSRGVQTQRGGPTPNPSEGAGASRGAATGAPGSGY